MNSPLSIILAPLWGCLRLRYVGDVNPVSVIPACDLMQLCAEAESSDSVTGLPGFD